MVKDQASVPQEIDAYIAMHPPKVRAMLTKIRRAVRKAIPDATETISYQMPTFMLNGVVLHFAAFTSHIGVYPPVRGDAALLKAVAPYANEKGNLRFPFDEPIPYDLIVRIAVSRAALNLAKRKRR
jgi:uncharacterized protein YdhG (YjbR/CyaY superfamily)